MHITIRQLQIIEAIVQTHSYSLAAERLYMTQPAISMQIKQLEHNIGVKLFERQGKRIVLSSAGQDIHPQIQRLITVTLKITNRQTLIKQLQDFEPDIVIMGEPPTKLDVIAERLIPNSFVAIAAPEHHLAKKKNITLAEIADEDLILRESGSGTRAVIESHFKSNNIDFNSSLEMGSNESIKHAVSAGLGIGAVSMA